MRMAMRFPVLSALSLAFGLTGCLGMHGAVGPIEGRLVNRTDIPTESFTVRYSFTCRKDAFLGPKPRCGELSQEVHPDAEGRYTIPAMDLSTLSGSEYELEVDIELPKDAKVGRAAMANGRWYAFDGEISGLIEEVKTVTVLPFAAQNLSFELASGAPSSEWAVGQGRDSKVEYKLDFSLGKEDPIDSRKVITIEKSGATSASSIETLAPAVLFVPGERAADARVKVTGKVINGQLSREPLRIIGQVSEELAYAPALPERLRAIAIDDRAFPALGRAIDGSWDVSLHFNESYAPGYESNFFDGKLEIACVRGELSGSMKLAPRGGNAFQWSGTVDVAGPCRGETGTIQARMKYASNRPEKAVSIAYERINLGSTRVSARTDASDAWLGEYSVNLTIRDESGKKIGTATIQKGY